MLWNRFVLILMLALVSARPSPELSLEEIEKELEQLTAQENDASETTKKASGQADTEKDTQTEVSKELSEKTKDVPKEELEALTKSVTETEQKKDETDKTKAETEKTADTSADPAVAPKKPVKPAPFEIPHRDTTDTDIERDDLSSRGLPKLSFKDTAAYKRLLEIVHPRLPSLPKLRALPAAKRRDFPEAPIRRTYDGYYSKRYDYPPNDSSWNQRGFLPNSDPVEALRGISSEMARAEHMALARGTWLPDKRPVRVLPKLPAPVKPDVRSYNDVHRQLNDKETEDLIHGKTGLTDAEKRKRFLMDLLAEKLKSRVSEAQKRGLKIPTKIMDFLWDYEARRGLDTQPDKNRLSH